MYCSNCGGVVEDGTKFCSNCGCPADETTAEGQQTPPDRSEKPKSKLRLLFIIPAVLVVVGIIGAFVVHQYIYSNPFYALGLSLNNLLKADSLTYDGVVEVEDDEISIDGKAEYSIEDYSVISEGSLKLDDFSVDYSLDYAEEDGAIRFSDSDGDSEKFNLDKGSDEGDLVIAIFDIANSLGNIISIKSGEADYDYLEDFLDDELDLDIHAEKIPDVSKKIIKALSEKDTLENVLHFTKTKQDGKTVYAFKPDIQDSLILIAENTKELFVDTDEYEELMDELEDEDDFDDMDLSFSFSVDSRGRLCALEADGDDSYDSFEAQLTIADFNKTTVLQSARVGFSSLPSFFEE